MKTLLLTLLLLGNKEVLELDTNVFIYEYPSKIKGQALIGVVLVNDNSSSITEVSYKITYRDGRIRTIKRRSDEYSADFIRNESGVFIKSRGIQCYDDRSFVSHQKYSQELYTLLGENFQQKGNRERYEALEGLG